jgi:pimeloyl-ACP methyl ester carboxylesterase
VPLAGEPGTVAMLTTPDSLYGDRALNPDNGYPEWQQAIAARSALRIMLYRPGRSASWVRCPLLVLVCDQDQTVLAGPAARAAKRAPGGELVRMPGGHYEPFLGGHEQAVEAELSFLRRHLLDSCARGPARRRGFRAAPGRPVMKQIELSAGTIEYQDTGDGPPLVLLHGLMMDASLWDEPIADLSADHRCVAPTLPLGAHRHAMHAGADLSLPGIARLVAEFVDRLGLQDVTLVGNDTGGALVQLLIRDGAPRAGRVVLVSCDAFDNFPPGLTGKALVLAGKLPPAMFGMFMQQMRLRPMRRLPIAFGWLTMRGDAATARWLKPVLTQPEIRRDAVRVLRAAAADTHLLVEAAERLPGFNHPALVVWAAGDRVMPPEHGRRLAELLPQGHLVEVADSYTLIPLDQPARLAQIIRDFTRIGAA